MWGSPLDGSRRFFFSSNTVAGDSGPPLIPKPEAMPVDGAKHSRYVINGEMLRSGGRFLRGGAANKEVIKHLFLRRNKKEREKHAHAHTHTHTQHSHTHTHFGVFVLLQQKLSAALILTKIKNPPF